MTIQHFSGVDLTDCAILLSDKDVQDAECAVGFKIPHTFKKFLKVCNGGFPIQNEFFYLSNYSERFRGSCVGSFLGVKKNEESQSDSIVSYYQNPPEFFPEKLLIFATVGNGDEICFDYRADPTTDNPPVVIWEHEAASETDPDQSISFVAADFESFMNMLMSDEEAEAEYERLTKTSPD